MKRQKMGIGLLMLIGIVTVCYAQERRSDTTETVKQIDNVILKAQKKRGNEVSLINAQKRSIAIIERVGVQQLDKQGVGDVATAVTKASGIQKQAGDGQILVRGLGDRFNTTTLNGLPIPSDDPEFKNINLGLFKTSMVEYISLDKVYNPQLNGDFGGANINISSKEQSGKSYFKIGVGSSYNVQTLSKTFKLQDGGPGFLGFKVIKFKKSIDEYPFQSKWNFTTVDNPFNSNMDIEAGVNLGKVRVFTYAGFDNQYVFSKGEEGFYDATGDAIKQMNVERYEYETNTTAIVNVVYNLNKRNKLSLSSNFIHTSAQDARSMGGYIREVGSDILINRGDNKLTKAWINQLFGNHEFFRNWELDWGIAYNSLNSQRPDRLQNTFDAQSLQLITASAINNHRYYDVLKDQTYNVFFNFSKQWAKLKLTTGYFGQYKKRNFDNTTIGLNFSTQFSIDPNNVDAFINASNHHYITYNTFRPDSEKFKPFYYEFKQNTQSSFLNFDYQITDKFVIQLGGRYDFVDIQNRWDDPIFQKAKKYKTYYKFLPAFNLKYSINDRQNLRLAATKTYTLPQPKELVPIGYYDVTTNVYGNPLLYASDNYNADLKWEFFPQSGEIISLSLFGKYIANPIARTTYSTAASSDMTYFNIANWGYIYGAEVEFRKDLVKGMRSRLYTFLNATYMQSEQQLKSESEFSLENEGKVIQFSGQARDKIQGVADFLANINLGYHFKLTSANSLDLVVSYAYVGKSLFAIGTNGVGNFYEKPVQSLDTNLRLQFKAIGLGIYAKNLLNPDYRITQNNSKGNFIHRNYTKGRVLGLNVSYQF